MDETEKREMCVILTPDRDFPNPINRAFSSDQKRRSTL